MAVVFRRNGFLLYSQAIGAVIPYPLIQSSIRIFELGELVIDYGARRVTLSGSEIKLTQTEFNIVALLSEHCGKVLTYSVMISNI